MGEAKPEISRDDVKQAIMEHPSTLTDASVDIERKLRQLGRDETDSILNATERQEVIKMRSRWSNWILAVIVAISIFDMLLIVGIGLGLLVFTNDYAIPLFVAESLLKLLGLAFLIVHFLFDHKSFGGSGRKVGNGWDI